MVELGYPLSSEELGALALVESARRAERAGFSFALISVGRDQEPFVRFYEREILPAVERVP